eukprot:scaffold100461_cov40-Prasinocladus_malaysianus.AAC.1
MAGASTHASLNNEHSIVKAWSTIVVVLKPQRYLGAEPPLGVPDANGAVVARRGADGFLGVDGHVEDKEGVSLHHRRLWRDRQSVHEPPEAQAAVAVAADHAGVVVGEGKGVGGAQVGLVSAPLGHNGPVGALHLPCKPIPAKKSPSDITHVHGKTCTPQIR